MDTKPRDRRNRRTLVVGVLGLGSIGVLGGIGLEIARLRSSAGGPTDRRDPVDGQTSTAAVNATRVPSERGADVTNNVVVGNGNAVGNGNVVGRSTAGAPR